MNQTFFFVKSSSICCSLFRMFVQSIISWNQPIKTQMVFICTYIAKIAKWNAYVCFWWNKFEIIFIHSVMPFQNLSWCICYLGTNAADSLLGLIRYSVRTSSHHSWKVWISYVFPKFPFITSTSTIQRLQMTSNYCLHFTGGQNNWWISWIPDEFGDRWLTYCNCLVSISEMLTKKVSVDRFRAVVTTQNQWCVDIFSKIWSTLDQNNSVILLSIRTCRLILWYQIIYKKKG